MAFRHEIYAKIRLKKIHAICEVMECLVLNDRGSTFINTFKDGDFIYFLTDLEILENFNECDFQGWGVREIY